MIGGQMIELNRTYIGSPTGGTDWILLKSGDFYEFGTEYDVCKSPWGCPVQDCGTKEEVLERLHWLAGFERKNAEKWRNQFHQESLAIYSDSLSEWYERCEQILLTEGTTE